MAKRSGTKEKGVALVSTMIIMGLLSVVALTVLAVVASESRMTGSDLDRTKTLYAAAAGIEKMTTDFSEEFSHNSRPTTAQLNAIAANYPPELVAEGFSFTAPTPSLIVDPINTSMTNHSVQVPTGPFAGLNAGVTPYIMTETATHVATGTQVSLRRTINNYLIPIFQFGMFSNEDMELHPGAQFTFNGRVHANGNLYVNGLTRFLSKVTTGHEVVRDVLRNGFTHTGTVNMTVGTVDVLMTNGSVLGGPSYPGQTSGQANYFPTSPTGSPNPAWAGTSVAAATTGVNNQFGGQLQTIETGASPLLLPLQLDGNPTRELVKRREPNDLVNPLNSTALHDARYDNQAQIRILIDDENVTNDAAGIPIGQGVNLSSWDPQPLPNSNTSSGGGRALWKINDDGTYADSSSTCVLQELAPNPSPSPSATPTPTQAVTVRATKAIASPTPITLAGVSTVVPGGSGITGRILIQVVDQNGVGHDVTQQVLSMGVTEGEPNAIVMLQRPLWAAYTQGTRDAGARPGPSPAASPASTNPALNSDSAYYNNLVDITNLTHIGADGEISANPYSSPSPTPTPIQEAQYGYLTQILDDTKSGQRSIRSIAPPSTSNLLSDWGATTCGSGHPDCWGYHADWNAIVPINVYNVREGWTNTTYNSNQVYERGITSVVEVNMRNLARWIDGVYDGNLLAGTAATSANIVNPNKPEGYIVYVSDRRGDKVKTMVDTSGATIQSTNGMVDNEDIYTDGALTAGEDVQGTGSLVHDTNELPDPNPLSSPNPVGGSSPSYGTDRMKRSIYVNTWMNPNNYFRRAVRLFDGDDLQITGAAGKLSSTKGLAMVTENMLYIWGNYNTSGINCQPTLGSTLNDPTQTCHYFGNQVPASITADALFPLSRNWFDSSSSINPDNSSKRPPDINLPPAVGGVLAETAVRVAVIAGNNLSALAGTPDAGQAGIGESRLNGGMHNFPRFSEAWGSRWNFVGSLIPLYHSTQAVGAYHADGPIYGAPTRNWAFDDTFKDPNRLPPGTPLFQYVQPTGFRQVLD